MKTKSIFTIAICMLCIFSVLADDIYYRPKKDKKEKTGKTMQKPNIDFISQLSPDELQQAVMDFGKKALNYKLDKMSKETTIGKLILKKWYEFNTATMQLNPQFYTEYTLTNRIVVGTDDYGNLTERFQKYYLSDKYETSFDTTKVGWTQNGKYIVLQSTTKPSRAISMHIDNITDTELQITEELQNTNIRKMYVGVSERPINEVENISPDEMLLNKTWALIDEKTGNPSQYEFYFEPFGYMEKCVLGENRRTSLPIWFIGEYYFSNEIDTVFTYNKMDMLTNGRYLVNHIKEYDGDHMHTYEINILPGDTILLKCVYPAGGENIRLARLEKFNSVTTLEKLVGKQWRLQQERYDKYTYKHSHSGALYFTESQFIGPRAKTTDNTFIDAKIYRPRNFHLSDIEYANFYFKIAETKPQYGKYIIYGIDGQQGPRSGSGIEILYVSDNMLVIRYRGSIHHSIYVSE